MNEKTVNFRGLVFSTFMEKDIETLTPIMKRAFDEDTKMHTDKEQGGPDGYDNGDFLSKWFLHKDATSFMISKEGKPIGGMALWINQNNVNFLGNIFIDPELQSKGLGKIIWEFVEIEFPDTIKWQTETPVFSRRNHHFYVNKCGFKIVHIDNPKNNDESCQYQMEKEMKVR